MNKIKHYQKYIYALLIVLFFAVYLGYSLISGEVVKPNNPYENKDEQVSKVSLRQGLEGITETPDKEKKENKEEPAESEPDSDESVNPEPKPKDPDEPEPKPEDPVDSEPNTKDPDDPDPEPEEPGDPDPEPEEPGDSDPEPEKPGDPDPEPEEPGDPDPKPEEPVDPDPEPEEPVDLDPEPEDPVDPDPEPGDPVDPDPEPEDPVDPDPEPEKPVDPDPEPEKPVDPDPEPEDPVDPDPKPEEPVAPDPEPEEDIIGTASVSLVAETLGKGTLESNSAIKIIEGDSAADLLNRFFVENGITYENAGNINAGFYLQRIHITGINKNVNIPEELLIELEERNITVDLDVNDVNSLGEFDYTMNAGWMHSINGIDPNVGYSDYVVADGDEIRIRFVLFVR